MLKNGSLRSSLEDKMPRPAILSKVALPQNQARHPESDSRQRPLPLLPKFRVCIQQYLSTLISHKLNRDVKDVLLLGAGPKEDVELRQKVISNALFRIELDVT